MSPVLMRRMPHQQEALGVGLGGEICWGESSKDAQKNLLAEKS
jgi:hypothetical protein